MSHFGDLVRELRKQRGLSLEKVAREIRTYKSYICGIEKDQVNPPSVKMILRFAKVFNQDPGHLIRLAWVDKAPALIRKDAEQFLAWYQSRHPQPREASAAPPRTPAEAAL